MDKKIIAVHMYAAVEVDNKRETYLSIRDRRRTFTFTFLKDLGVEIVGKKDTIIVPFSNIACLLVENREEAAPEASKVEEKPQKEDKKKAPKFIIK